MDYGKEKVKYIIFKIIPSFLNSNNFYKLAQAN